MLDNPGYSEFTIDTGGNLPGQVRIMCHRSTTQLLPSEIRYRTLLHFCCGFVHTQYSVVAQSNENERENYCAYVSSQAFYLGKWVNASLIPMQAFCFGGVENAKSAGLAILLISPKAKGLGTRLGTR